MIWKSVDQVLKIYNIDIIPKNYINRYNESYKPYLGVDDPDICGIGKFNLK